MPVITNAGEYLITQQQQAGEPLIIDQMILANITGLDSNTVPNREQSMPAPADVKIIKPITKDGLLNTNTVVYSTVFPSTDGTFDFNYMGLYSSAHDVIVAVAYVPLQTKIKTVGTDVGNVITKNFAIEFNAAADITGINISAESWQIDYTARLLSMDKHQRDLVKNIYGPSTFLNDAFKVKFETDKYYLTAGKAILGGINFDLEADLEIVPGALPQTVWLDVYQETSMMGVLNKHDVVINDGTVLTDYLTGSVEHTLVKLGVVNSSVDIVDGRSLVKKSLELRTKRDEVASIAELRNTKPEFPGQKIHVTSYYDGWAASVRGPVGGGDFVYDDSDRSSNDDGGYIIVNIFGDRFKRILSGDNTPEKWGAMGDGINNDSLPVYNCVNFGGESKLNYNYAINGLGIAFNNIKISGRGSLILIADSNKDVIYNESSSRLFNVHISEITLECNGAIQTAMSNGINLNNTLGLRVWNTHIKNAFSDGINIAGAASPLSLSLDTYIHHNRIENSGGFGLDFSEYSGTLEASFNIIGKCGMSGIRVSNVDARIIGNHIFAAEEYGIEVGISNANSQIEGNHVESNRKHGIFLSGTSHGSIVGNVCVKNGRGSTPNTYDGIHLAKRSGLDCSEITITGNTCWAENVEDGGLLVQRYGIFIEAGSNNIICTNNALGGNESGGIMADGVIKSVIKDNTPIERARAVEFYDVSQAVDLSKTVTISVSDSNATHKGVVGMYDIVVGYNNAANSLGYLGSYVLTVTKETNVGFSTKLDQVSGTTTGIVVTTPINTATELQANIALTSLKGIYIKAEQRDINIGNYFDSELSIT